MHLTRKELRRMAGEVMICGFSGMQVDAELKEVLREINPLGLIAFARNVESIEAVSALNQEIKALTPDQPRLLSVDQEGGRVARLRAGVTRFPPMAALGRLDDSALAYSVGQGLAQEVRAVGFDMDYAPVLDVNTNPQNPVIGNRALSDDPVKAARLGAALVRGLQDAGVAACGKHFPGHGDTDVDSHYKLPTVEHERARLDAIEWQPFRAAIDAKVAAIMTAHVVANALDDVPATLSKRVLQDELRGHLGFGGAIFSDDIDMKALADHFGPDEMGIMGLMAGIDVFLACRDPAAMMALYRGIVMRAEDKTLPHKVLAERAARAAALRQRYAQPVLPWRKGRLLLEHVQHQNQALAERMQAVW